MMTRALCMLLTVLFFAAPLAAVCGSCLDDPCETTVTAPTAKAEPITESHCEKAAAAEESTASVRLEASPLQLVAECCVASAGAEPGATGIVTPSAGPAFALEPEGALGQSPVGIERVAQRRRAPLQPPPELFTLHAAFLI